MKLINFIKKRRLLKDRQKLLKNRQKMIIQRELVLRKITYSRENSKRFSLEVKKLYTLTSINIYMQDYINYLNCCISEYIADEGTCKSILKLCDENLKKCDDNLKEIEKQLASLEQKAP